MALPIGGTDTIPGREGLIGGGGVGGVVEMGQGSGRAGRALKVAVTTIAQHC